MRGRRIVLPRNYERFMNKRKLKLTLPAIRKLREAVGGNDIGGFLIDQCEYFNAGSCKVKFHLKNKPYVVTIEARRVKV